MENKAARRRILISLIIVVGMIMGWQILRARCYEPSETLEINAPFNITYVYPRPGAKLSFVCHLLAYSKSPFAPRMIYYAEEVIKEDGFPIRDSRYREGAIVVRIAIIDELYRQFPERVRTGSVPPFAKAVSLYVDGHELQIEHIGYREFDSEFI